MNILTFDIEDWYTCDYLTKNQNWDSYEYRVDKTLIPILEELEKRKIKGTFFCLGWLAEKHPDIIKEIDYRGHHIGCHSYKHELATRFSRSEFYDDTKKAKDLIEKVICKPVVAYRAPGFTITENNLWAVDVLIELGFKYDCSVFPSYHDLGGMPSFGTAEPVLLKTKSDRTIKEFPLNIHKILGQSLVFSGGGFFRFFPYWLIRNWGKKSDYMMTYFHPRDFDTGQPMIKTLPVKRKFKSYVGISRNFRKWRRLLDDFKFENLETADNLIDWSKQRVVKI